MSPIDVNRLFEQPDRDYTLRKYQNRVETDRLNSAKRKRVPTDALTKVYHNGQVVWLTSDEVQEILKQQEEDSGKESSLKSNVEKALYGSNRALAEEMHVLLYLTTQTLVQRIKDGTVTDKEAEGLTHNLRRRFDEIEENIDSLVNVENELTHRKKAEPVFARYESKMAEMLRLKKQGRMPEAAALAKQLMRDKKQYLLLSRALEPLVYAAYYQRLDLQKGKKRVLHIQEHLCEMRETLLQQALQALREDLSADDGTFEELTTASDSKEGQNMRKYQKELKSLALELKVLVNTIQEVDNVCDWIETEIFKDEKIKKVAIKHGQARKSARPGREAAKEPERRSGMAVMDRIKKKDQKGD